MNRNESYGEKNRGPTYVPRFVIQITSKGLKTKGKLYKEYLTSLNTRLLS